MAVWPNKCYFIRLGRTKEGQGRISIGQLKIFSILSGEGRGREEELKKNSKRGTREAEQGRI